MPFSNSIRGLLFLLISSFAPPLLGAAPFPPEDGEAIIKQALVRAGASIVRIETVGGLDVLEDILIGTGPTTGVVVTEDGYIITSSFNFASNPASILVTLPETEQRLAAEIVARDHARQLTLLKIDANDLVPATPVQQTDIQVGQWAIALGRTYDSSLPNVSIGLISALGRIEGKALQTDAKVSPANYGGPLVDLEGRVLGILAPLSPGGKGMTEGMNWYDSGIGFAIPLEHVLQTLERLKAGTDLHPGLMGVSFAATPGFLTKPVIEEVRPNSPAAQAGLQTKDLIIRISDQSISTVSGLRQILGQKYAGESLPLTVQRGEEEVSLELTLAEKVEAFRFGWLGLMGERANGPESTGVTITHVFPGSPAEQAGLKKQDLIQSISEEEVPTTAALQALLSLKQPGETVILAGKRGEAPLTWELTLAAIPTDIPADLPQPVLTLPESAPAGAAAETGELTRQVPGQERTYQLYVPDDYQRGIGYGYLMWLSATGEPIPREQLAEWKRICRQRGLILIMPASVELQPWSADDALMLQECLDQVQKDYSIDSSRTCLITSGAQATFPWLFAFENKDDFQGLLAFTLPGRFQATRNEPGHPFQILITNSANEKEKAIQDTLTEHLTKEGFPVFRVDLPESLTAEHFDTLGRWLDQLGSF